MFIQVTKKVYSYKTVGVINTSQIHYMYDSNDGGTVIVFHDESINVEESINEILSRVGA